MANYPKVPFNADGFMQRWGNELVRELDTRDLRESSRPATKIYSVVTVTEIGRPASGDVAFAISAGKFRGYVSGTGWIDFH
jgi:hypothetical protein